MSQDNVQLLYEKDVQIFYPVIGINGKSELLFYNNPSLGLADVTFCPGGVAIRTINFDYKEIVTIRAYKGIPNFEILPCNSYTASGIIAVGEKRLKLFTGGEEEMLFPWNNGLSDVLVVLDAQEVMLKQVKTITFYAEPYKERVRHKYLKLFLRKEND